MMAHYNQPLSEIRKMTFDEMMFFIALKNAESQYEEQELKKQRKKLKLPKVRKR